MSWTREQLEQICLPKEQGGRGKDFRGLHLHGVDFTGMNLERADFRSARCAYANFSKTNCKEANFEGAHIEFTTWHGANCRRMNLKDAAMQDADMSQVTDFFGVTVTMECRSWIHLKLPPGFWYGYLFYGLLMEPPDNDAKERLQVFFGAERFKTLRDLYCTRQF